MPGEIGLYAYYHGGVTRYSSLFFSLLISGDSYKAVLVYKAVLRIRYGSNGEKDRRHHIKL